MDVDGKMKQKVCIILLCVIGLIGVFYGMVRENNLIFIVGIIFVIVGYLMLRKRLKESIRQKS